MGTEELNIKHPFIIPVVITSLVITLVYFMVMSHFGYKEVSQTKACVNSLTLGNARLDVLDSVLYQGVHHELAKFTSSSHDKVEMLVLYEKASRKGDCIPHDKSLSLEAAHYGSKVRWPRSITVKGYKIVVEYTSNKAKAKPLADINVNWE